MTEPLADLLVENVRIQDQLVDVVVDAGTIADVAPAGSQRRGAQTVVDGQGGLALPGLVDAHAHLDKTLWGLPWRPHSGAPGLAAMIANERTNRRELPPVADRAEALLRAYVASGVMHIRTHVDVDPECGLDSVGGIREAVRRIGVPIDVELVAFPQSGLLLEPGTLELLEAAVEQGVSIIGGVDPAECDRDPTRSLDALVDVAVRHGCGLDIHLHSRGELGAFEVDEVINRVEKFGLAGRVNLSHAFCLSTVSDARLAGLAERLAAHSISVTTVAAGTVPALPIRRLREAGVLVGLGQDGIRDLWSPFGTGDVLERAMMFAWQSGFRRDDDLELALATITTDAARILGLDDYGIARGNPATFIVVPASCPAEAVVAHPRRTLVVCRGMVVSGAAFGAETPTG